MAKDTTELAFTFATIHVVTTLIETLAASGQLDFEDFSMRLQERADAARHGDTYLAEAIDDIRDEAARNLAHRLQGRPPGPG